MQTTSRVAFLLASTALVATALAPDPARAQEGTADIEVRAFVEEACTISTNPIPINFGIYQDEQIVENASFTFDCPANKALAFTITGGVINGGGLRDLPNTDLPATTPLKYTIYTPNGGVWGDDAYTTTSLGDDPPEAFYAVLDGNQLANVSPGNFAQDLTLSMTVQ